MARSASTSRAEGGSRRQALIDAAARRLNRDGVRDSTLRDLAAELKLTRAALYYYIEDREDLVFQVYRRSCERLARALGQAVAAGGPVLQIVTDFVARALNPAEPEMADLSDLGLLREDDRATVLAIYEGVVARFADLLESGVRSGELRPLDPDIVARAVISMIQNVPHVLNVSLAESLLQPATYVEVMQSVLVRGWAADRRRKLNARPVDLTLYRARRVAAFDREALAEARREQIMITASRLFNRKGVDATSLDEIAAELRATKRTLYQYVGDKRALVSACLKRSHAITNSIEARALAERGPDVATIDAVTSSMRATARVWLCDDIMPMRLFLGYDAMTPEDQAMFAEYLQMLGANWAGYFTEMQASGEARALDLAHLLPMLSTAVAWLARGFISADDARQVEITTEIVDVHRLGLAAL